MTLFYLKIYFDCLKFDFSICRVFTMISSLIDLNLIVHQCTQPSLHFLRMFNNMDCLCFPLLWCSFNISIFVMFNKFISDDIKLPDFVSFFFLFFFFAFLALKNGALTDVIIHIFNCAHFSGTWKPILYTVLHHYLWST